ncbi:MAG: AMP-binding protein [Candidatus Eisenbacteria bacterium]|nr:AMP-binding protein [Candidatus Eisenbacteria bacterium]
MTDSSNSIDLVLNEGRRLTRSGIAFRREDTSLGYDALAEASECLARDLLRRGLRTGEKVAVAVPNRFEYPVAFIGIQRAGGVAVPINPQLTAREMNYILGHADARWMIVVPGFGPPEGWAPGKAFEGLLALQETGETAGADSGAANASAPAPPLPAPDPEREGVLIYTSGTTGVPKGVLLRQRNIIANARAVVDYLDLQPTDRHAVFLPLFYSYAMSQMLTTLLAGGEVVLLDGLLYPAAAVEEMARQGVSIIAGVPTTYNLLVRLKAFHRETLPRLRIFLNAGGPVHHDRLDELCSRFPDAKVVNNYGCTEAGPRVTYLPHEELHRRHSMGVAIPGMQVTLRDESGREVGPGELGEIHISGHSVMKGYYKNEVETRRVLTRNGLKSGDWATKDKDGFLYFKGRKVDIINTGGEKVSAREVEDVLMQHPGVKEVAVVGKADPILGEIVKAVIVPEQDGKISAEEILELAGRSLARHKVPRRVEFVKQLARTSSGKIRKVDLIG